LPVVLDKPEVMPGQVKPQGFEGLEKQLLHR
jgi:hypothetical protein